MRVYDARIRGTHPYSFKSGEWATIVGVVMIHEGDNEPRLNYVVRFTSGDLDYWPVCDSEHYEIESTSGRIISTLAVKINTDITATCNGKPIEL